MNKILSFIQNEDGSSTIEFVLWVPLFGFLLMLTVNTSFVFLDLMRMENAARDGARRVATGEFNVTTVEPFVLAQLPAADYGADTDCSNAEYACVKISRPTESMLPFRNFLGVGSLLGKSFGVTIRYKYEPGAYRS